MPLKTKRPIDNGLVTTHERIKIDKKLMEYICISEGVKLSAYKHKWDHWTIGCGALIELDLNLLRRKYRERNYSKERIDKIIRRSKKFNEDRANWFESYGLDVDQLKKGHIISSNLALGLAIDHIRESIDAAKVFAGADAWKALNSSRKSVLIDMAFNLGGSKLNRFPKMKKAIRIKDWKEAAEQIKSSAYFKQVGTRALRNYENMKKGNLNAHKHRLDEFLQPIFNKENFGTKIKEAVEKSRMDVIKPWEELRKRKVKEETEAQRKKLEAKRKAEQERVRKAYEAAARRRARIRQMRRQMQRRVRIQYRSGGGGGGGTITGSIRGGASVTFGSSKKKIQDAIKLNSSQVAEIIETIRNPYVQHRPDFF